MCKNLKVLSCSVFSVFLMHSPCLELQQREMESRMLIEELVEESSIISLATVYALTHRNKFVETNYLPEYNKVIFWVLQSRLAELPVHPILH